MQSFIITAKDKKKRVAYIKDYAEKNEIDRFDVTIIEKDSDAKATTQSIGIETVKLIQKKLFFKPLKSKNKILVIEDAQLLTPEAQNALLKVLEEPPANTYIFLGTETKETLLPTILSRCQIIKLEEEQKKLSEKTVNELQTFIQNLPEFSTSDKLKQAEHLAKDKEKAVVWIENFIVILREKLLSSISHSDTSIQEIPDQVRNDNINVVITYLIILKSFQTLYTLLKTTNVNPRFAIEHTLLSL
jgi:replication-associated recombination protein RarA